MIHRDVAIGIHIEGVPQPNGPGLLHLGGALFYYGQNPIDLGFPAHYHFEPVLDAIPGDVASFIDPYQASYDLSSLTVALVATDDVARRLWAVGEPIATVEEDSVFHVTVAHGADTLAHLQDTHIYIGDETLFVNNVQLLSPGVSRLSVERSIGLSKQEHHQPGADVYARLPYLAQRMVTLYLFVRGESAPQPIWRGLLVELSTDAQQTVFEITANEVLSVLSKARGAETPTLFHTDGRTLAWSDGGLTGLIAVDDAAAVDWVRPDIQQAFLRVGDAIVWAVRGERGFSWFTLPMMWSSAGDDGFVEGGTDIREVLCVDRDGRSGRDEVPRSSFDGLYGDVLGGHHPAAVALAFYLSDGTGREPLPGKRFNILGRKWGLGVPADLIDLDSWLEIIDAADIDPIDQMVLGYDGPFDFAKVIKDQLLVPAGLYPAMNQEGKLALFRLETFGVDTIVDVMARRAWSWLTPDRIDMNPQVSAAVQSVRAVVGGLPHVEPDEITTRQVRGNRSDSTAAAGTSSYEYDLSLYYRNATAAITRFEAAAHRRLRPPPILHCVLPMNHSMHGRGMQGGKVPGIGSWVIIDGGPETGMLGPDGERIQMGDADVLFVGILVGRTIKNNNGTVECEVLLVNYWSSGRASRVIAPAGKIIDFDHDSVRLDHTYSAADGTTGFMVGDKVRIWTDNGRKYLYGVEAEIWSIDESTRWIICIQNMEPFGSPDWHRDVEHGLYLRLVPRPQYSNDYWPGSQYYRDALKNRRFAFIGARGDSDDELDRYV